MTRRTEYWLRVGKSNYRVKENRLYVMNDIGKIRDDHGKEMRPQIGSQHHWLPCTIKHRDSKGMPVYTCAKGDFKTVGWDAKFIQDDTSLLNSLTRDADIDHMYPHVMNTNLTGWDSSPYPTEYIKTEGKPMKLEIKNVTLINGTQADCLSEEQIIKMMSQENDHIKRLDELNLNSKAVDRIMKRHEENIEALEKILAEKVANG